MQTFYCNTHTFLSLTFSCEFLMWVFREPFWVNDFSHFKHLKGVLLLWTSSLWFSKVTSFLHSNSQMSHLKFELNSLWESFMCVNNPVWYTKILSHISHFCFIFSKWDFSCFNACFLDAKLLPQRVHFCLDFMASF